MTARRAQSEVSTGELVRYLQGEMTRSESEETERRVADSRRAQEKLAELRQMTEALRRPPDWVAATDLTAGGGRLTRFVVLLAETERVDEPLVAVEVLALEVVEQASIVVPACVV